MSDILPRVTEALAIDPKVYREAKPFPHIVIDNFLPEDVLDEVIAAFPTPDSPIWNERLEEVYLRKLGSNEVDGAPAPIRDVLYQLNSASVLKAMEALTGEGPLISDPFYIGGGMHQIEPGGRLSVHADFNQPGHLPLFRRLNLLIYLNKDWDPSYEGSLELWSRDGKKKVKAVEPIANRAVIFTTDTQSLHGHPVPLACPPGRTRKSLALYYYSIEAPGRMHTGVTTRWRLETEKEHQTARQKLATLLWRTSYKFADFAIKLEKGSQ